MAWNEFVPWTDFAMVEQDLIISRALVDIHGNINIEKTLECYSKYMDFVVEKAPTYKQFVQNMELKLQDPEFLDDTDILLRTGVDKFDPQRAYAMVKNAFIDKLPGKRD